MIYTKKIWPFFGDTIVIKDLSTDKYYYTQKEVDEIKEAIIDKWLSSRDSELTDDYSFEISNLSTNEDRDK